MCDKQKWPFTRCEACKIKEVCEACIEEHPEHIMNPSLKGEYSAVVTTAMPYAPEYTVGEEVWVSRYECTWKIRPKFGKKMLAIGVGKDNLDISI